MSIVESRSISKPPYYDGKNYREWKGSMERFIKSVDFRLWLLIKNGPKVPKNTRDGEEIEKGENEFNDEEMKMMEQEAKAKHILCCALNQRDLTRVSSCNTAKEMWNNVERKLTRDDLVSIIGGIHQEEAHESYLELVSGIQVQAWAALKTSNSVILNETSVDLEKGYYSLRGSIHNFALEGNWAAAKTIIDKHNRLKNGPITDSNFTLLHIAAGANQIEFVKQLLNMLDKDDLELKDYNDRTAFCFAAAAGNINIVDLMLEKNPELITMRDIKTYTPIQNAALLGRCKMTWHLYDRSKPRFNDNDWKLLFFTCINSGIYDIALKMAEEHIELATARDSKDNTALHLLSQQTSMGSCCHDPEHDGNSVTINPDMTRFAVLRLVYFLWTTILEKNRNSMDQLKDIRNKPFKLIFEAAKIGNFEFLSVLVREYPSLIWDLDSENQTILHFAVLHRHADFFELLKILGKIKGDSVIGDYKDKQGNTILHLAAKLAPPDKLEWVSGAAFQMALELLWFEKVKQIMSPRQIKLKNIEGSTAQDIFTEKHDNLRKQGEEWMKKTAESCMLVSTVIATGVFTAATSLPGGTNDDTGKPNYLSKTSFLVFAISDALALISSSTAILIFLSILVSRYRESDFNKSLPLKLICGLFTLFISIASMMVAFGSAFFIIYYHGLKWVPSSIAILSSIPILLYIRLQFSLFLDIISPSFYWWKRNLMSWLIEI